MAQKKKRRSDDWDAWEAELAQREKAKRAFTDAVRFGLERNAIYELRNSFPYNGRTVIHRSTRPGVVWQVTWLDDKGPSGHSDQQTIEGAAARAWEDAHPVERARFGA